jgi:8-oxo-dGTP pyrophosphatase MutT (NUDIX family)
MEVKYNELHRVVLTAIIYNSDKKFLITKRASGLKVYPDKWTVPGGGLEVTDYINTQKTTSDSWYFIVENALGREIKEEVGLKIGRQPICLILPL